MTREEAVAIVNKYDGKYPHYSVSSFIEYSGMSKEEIDVIIDSYTNPIIFKQNADGTFAKDEEGNLIRNIQIN